MREYDLPDKPEFSTVVLILVIAFSALLYLVIELYSKQIIPDDDPLASHGISYEKSANGYSFNKK